MALHKQEEPSYEKIVGFINSLPLEKQEELRRTLNKKTWGQRWQNLCDRVQENSKGLPPLSDDEINAEIKAARRERES